MRIVRDVKYDYYTCVRYQSASKRFDRECSRHGIRRDVIEQIVLAKIQETAAEARSDKDAFVEKISKASNRNNEQKLKAKTAEIAKTERRVADLDKIIKRIYEDNISGRL
jgi:hypothetical protein